MEERQEEAMSVGDGEMIPEKTHKQMVQPVAMEMSLPDHPAVTPPEQPNLTPLEPVAAIAANPFISAEPSNLVSSALEDSDQQEDIIIESPRDQYNMQLCL